MHELARARAIARVARASLGNVHIATSTMSCAWARHCLKRHAWSFACNVHMCLSEALPEKAWSFEGLAHKPNAPCRITYMAVPSKRQSTACIALRFSAAACYVFWLKRYSFFFLSKHHQLQWQHHQLAEAPQHRSGSTISGSGSTTSGSSSSTAAAAAAAPLERCRSEVRQVMRIGFAQLAVPAAAQQRQWQHHQLQ